MALLGPNFKNLVPNNACWPKNFRLALWLFFGHFSGYTGPLQVLDPTTLVPVWDTIFFHSFDKLIADFHQIPIFSRFSITKFR